MAVEIVAPLKNLEHRMSVEVKWLIEKHIISATMSGIADHASIQQISKGITDLYPSGTERWVHALVDGRDVEKITVTLRDIRDLNPR